MKKMCSEIRRSIDIAKYALQKLNKVLNKRKCSVERKKRVLHYYITSVNTEQFLYKKRKSNSKRLEAIYMCFYRGILIM